MLQRPHQLSNVFFVVKPSQIVFLTKILYPKRRIESYCLLGTIVSPNRILLNCQLHVELLRDALYYA